jgi:hypothetical protein
LATLQRESSLELLLCHESENDHDCYLLGIHSTSHHQHADPVRTL